jgi:hypothetical protein
MDIGKTEATLKSLGGLYKAIKGYPALLVLIIVSVAILELIAPQASLLIPGLSASTLHLFIVVIGTLLGLTGYFAGDFWDSRLFDPRYGLEGKWLHSTTRPFDVFPAGRDLKDQRDKAIQALFGNGHSGRGIYREAKRVAMKQSKEWEYIEQPLILSKFVRGFIWPCFLIAVATILGAIGSLILGWTLKPTVLAITGVVVCCFGVLLLIPYFQLRVDHMIRLYEYVCQSTSKK